MVKKQHTKSSTNGSSTNHTIIIHLNNFTYNTKNSSSFFDAASIYQFNYMILSQLKTIKKKVIKNLEKAKKNYYLCTPLRDKSSR
jgi:expansin (peptidoglycan-binding protein)